jgi:hypothetical protein
LRPVRPVGPIGRSWPAFAARPAWSTFAAWPAFAARHLQRDGVEAAGDEIFQIHERDNPAFAAHPAAATGSSFAATPAGATRLMGQGRRPARPAFRARPPWLALRTDRASRGDGSADELTAYNSHAWARRTSLERFHLDRAVGAVKAIGEQHQVPAIQGKHAVHAKIACGEQDRRAHRGRFELDARFEVVVEDDAVAEECTAVCHRDLLMIYANVIDVAIPA